jgi:hypothetical protein
MAGRPFTVPFATTGDRTSVPTAVQPSGAVSYSEGFGPDYELPNTDPDYKPVPREETNSLYFDITEALGIMQKQGVADYDAAFSPYAINAVVRYANETWLSKVASNASVPGTDANWSSLAGFIGPNEQATQAEAEAGTNNTKWMTPLRVFQALRSAAANASDTLRGVLRIATQAEVNAGSSTVLAVTPGRMLAGFSVSTGANGYVKFPQMLGGIIIQWGSVNGGPSNAEYNADITFPVTFTNACRAVVGTAGDPTYSATEWVVHTWILSTTQFHIQLNPVTNVSQERKATWIAIGS